MKFSNYFFSSILGILGGFVIVAPVAQAYTPNDPEIANQTYLARIGAFGAWDYVRNLPASSEITVAVLDTGVDIHHPDLANQIWVNKNEIPNNGIDDDHNSFIDDVNGWNFVEANNDPEPNLAVDYSYDAINHGTIVAGIIGAAFDNGIGIAGLVPKVKIMPIRALDSKGTGNTMVVAQAIDYAVENGAQVINLSLVGKLLDQNLEAAIQRAYNAGVAVVAAAGNEQVNGVDLNSDPRYPVCDVGDVNMVLGVASIDSQNVLSDFSDYGNKCVDVVAPGTDIFSTSPFIPTNSAFTKYYSGGWNGTSVAAPMVTALVAMMKQVAPNLSLERIYQIINKNSTNLSLANPAKINGFGNGLINMEASLAEAKNVSQRQQPIFVIAPLSGKPEISLVNTQGQVIGSFLAYQAGFLGGVHVVTADLDNDGKMEIITAPAGGGGPHVKVFSADGQLKGQFMAYDPLFRGGVDLAVGDLDNDGKMEIITAPAGGGGPHVKVFDASGHVKSQFMAYAESFRGGVVLSVGDVDNDGLSEIVTVPRSSGGPHVRIFDSTGSVKGQFMAYASTLRAPLSLAVNDLDGDHQAEIVVGDGLSAKGEFRIFDYLGNQKNSWLAFPGLDQTNYKVNALAEDFTGDLRPDLIVYPIDNRSKVIKLFGYTGQLMNSITAGTANAGGWSLALIYK